MTETTHEQIPRVLIIRGDLNSHSGYARATSLYLSTLETRFDIILGVDIHAHPTRHVTIFPYPLIDDFQLAKLARREDVAAVVLTISTPNNFKSFSGAKNIGLFFWETTRLGNERWITSMHRVDEVWVPTRFMQPMLEAEGLLTPIRYMPCPIPPSRVQTAPGADDGLVLREIALSPAKTIDTISLAALRARSDMLFLSINSFIPRKGFPVLADAWLDLAGRHPGSALIIKATSIDSTETPVALFGRIQHLFQQVSRRHAIQHSQVYVAAESLPESTMQTLSRTCDGFISMSFGEGLGLGLFETLLAGKPVICPRHTSFKDFLPSDYPYFVSTDVANYGLADPVGVNPVTARWGVPREGSLQLAVAQLAADLRGGRCDAVIERTVAHFLAHSQMDKAAL
jgi:glycosyltransferase involved in cell wall biosynthesis